MTFADLTDQDLGDILYVYTRGVEGEPLLVVDLEPELLVRLAQFIVPSHPQHGESSPLELTEDGIDIVQECIFAQGRGELEIVAVDH